MADRGIDVSEYQGLIDWQKVKNAGNSFSMIRCGYGRFINQKDARFEENYANAKSVGMAVGTYHFGYATTTEQARTEAENCLSIIRGKKFEYPIAYDIEAPGQRTLSREQVSEIAETFCSILESNGYYVSIYSNLYFLNNKLSDEIKSKYDIWLAQWASEPTYPGSFGIWQYSSTGTVNGISGAVDLDFSYKNYPEIMKLNSLNGFSGSDEAPEIFAGKPLFLSSVPIFSTSASRRVSARVSGTYYVYSETPVNGRYRITNRLSFVGRRPSGFFVTGWINAFDIR